MTEHHAATYYHIRPSQVNVFEPGDVSLEEERAYVADILIEIFRDAHEEGELLDKLCVIDKPDRITVCGRRGVPSGS